MYSKEVLKRFRHPKLEGEIRNADAKVTVGNGICTDRLQLYIKMKGNRIKDIKYLTYGCPAAVSSAELVCELAKGKTLKIASKITFTKVLKKLKLPQGKYHCCKMSITALKEVIKKYEKNIHNNNSI